MPVEIERKFLVAGDDWRAAGTGTRYRQGYLARQGRASIRVRSGGGNAWLTVKGETHGATRAEYEYPVPPAEADEMLESLCLQPLIEKTRYRVDYGGRCWEVDVFAGENAGLVVAEVELDAEDEVVDLPPWVGEEVTGDPRYYNVNLVSRPYRTW